MASYYILAGGFLTCLRLAKEFDFDQVSIVLDRGFTNFFGRDSLKLYCQVSSQENNNFLISYLKRNMSYQEIMQKK